MEELSSSNLAMFLTRFGHCYDGLVRYVKMDYETKEVVVVLSVQDRETRENDGWVNLVLTVKEVSKFILIENRSTCVVLSSGLQVGFYNGKIYLDFSPYTEEPDGVDDFMKSHFLVVGKKCVWSPSCLTDS
jgi:hypothetical protein